MAVLVTSSGETNVATEEAAADVDKTETAEAVAEAVVAAFEACAHAGDGIPTPPLSRITHCKCRACKWSSEDRHTFNSVGRAPPGKRVVSNMTPPYSGPTLVESEHTRGGV